MRDIFMKLGKQTRKRSYIWQKNFQSDAQTKNQQTFSVKDQKINIVGFVGHSVSIVTIQLCH